MVTTTAEKYGHRKDYQPNVYFMAPDSLEPLLEPKAPCELFCSTALADANSGKFTHIIQENFQQSPSKVISTFSLLASTIIIISWYDQ